MVTYCEARTTCVPSCRRCVVTVWPPLMCGTGVRRVSLPTCKESFIFCNVLSYLYHLFNSLLHFPTPFVLFSNFFIFHDSLDYDFHRPFIHYFFPSLPLILSPQSAISHVSSSLSFPSFLRFLFLPSFHTYSPLLYTLHSSSFSPFFFPFPSLSSP